MNYFSYTISEDDARLIVQTLRERAYQLVDESDRAHSKGCSEYAAVIYNESCTYHDIADFFSLKLSHDL